MDLIEATEERKRLQADAERRETLDAEAAGDRQTRRDSLRFDAQRGLVDEGYQPTPMPTRVPRLGGMLGGTGGGSMVPVPGNPMTTDPSQAGEWARVPGQSLAERVEAKKTGAETARRKAIADDFAAAQTGDKEALGRLLADDPRFGAQFPAEKPETPRNIDPLSQQGVAARLQIERGKPVRPTGGSTPAVRLRPVPQGIVVKVSGNDRQLSAIDAALTGIADNPHATGFKGFAPDWLLNRADADGRGARASVGDVGSLLIHDRSGAAVTISESPRLKPFVPLITDNAATVKQKLARLRALLAEETDALASNYTEESGYFPLKRGGESADAVQRELDDELGRFRTLIKKGG